MVLLKGINYQVVHIVKKILLNSNKAITLALKKINEQIINKDLTMNSVFLGVLISMYRNFTVI